MRLSKLLYRTLPTIFFFPCPATSAYHVWVTVEMTWHRPRRPAPADSRENAPKWKEQARQVYMGNSSCFASGPGMTFVERTRAKSRYCSLRDKGASELSRDNFMNLLTGNHCADRLFRVVDKDKSGALSFKEICEAVVTSRTMETMDSKLQVLFKFYDKDGDGKLSRFEVADAMRLACNDVPLPRPQLNQLVQTIFSAYDQDKDAHLSFHEFSNVMKAAGIEYHK